MLLCTDDASLLGQGASSSSRGSYAWRPTALRVRSARCATSEAILVSFWPHFIAQLLNWASTNTVRLAGGKECLRQSCRSSLAVVTRYARATQQHICLDFNSAHLCMSGCQRHGKGLAGARLWVSQVSQLQAPAHAAKHSQSNLYRHDIDRTCTRSATTVSCSVCEQGDCEYARCMHA